jgi:heterodisulfide reductase subunit A
MSRIGVFICWCGENIARTVDVEKVAEVAKDHPGVVVSEAYKYMCSAPGQDLVAQAIKEHNLTGVVIGSCSPRMHEVTFRRACADAGLNPYLCEMANLREHCSWVHPNKDEGTEKSIGLVRMMIEKVKKNHALYPIEVPVTKTALVIGGGIAGIQTALDIANGGHKVVLVERSPSIGGHMLQLSETFPTLDCSQCILTPRMVEVATNPNIELLTYAELEDLDGYIGNYKAKIRMKARSVDLDKCTGCGDCIQKCPMKKISSEFDAHVGKRTAIYTPSPQAVPNKPVIDRDNCMYFKKGKCGVCKKICQKDAIDYEQTDQIVEYDVGAVVVATGYDLFGKENFKEYGYGEYADVIDGMQFERLASASGPTGGEIKRPSDGKIPHRVVFLQCAGSRDPEHGVSYCSKICCMYTAKHTMLYKHKVHHGQAYVFYMDVRAGGKNYDEFVRRAIEEDEALYLRGRVSKIYKRKDGTLIIKGADTISGEQIELEADMVVLATALVSDNKAIDLAQKVGIGYDSYGFMNEAHPKLKPVETNTAGVYLAGACRGAADIPDSVAQASAAASKVQNLFSKSALEREPTIAEVNETTCIGCFACMNVCPYNAPEEKELRDRGGKLIRKVATINPGVCQGCGLCLSVCRPKAVDLNGFTDEQIFSQLELF